MYLVLALFYPTLEPSLNTFWALLVICFELALVQAYHREKESASCFFFSSPHPPNSWAQVTLTAQLAISIQDEEDSISIDENITLHWI